MTWKELIVQVRDLGFEEDTTMEDMKSMVVTSTNLAMSAIYRTIVQPNSLFFEEVLQESADEPKKMTLKTPDTEVLELPDMVIDLLPLLTSFFVWQDDEPTKAAIYKNQYEDVKELIMMEMNRPRKFIFGQGLRW